MHTFSIFINNIEQKLLKSKRKFSHLIKNVRFNWNSIRFHKSKCKKFRFISVWTILSDIQRLF